MLLWVGLRDGPIVHQTLSATLIAPRASSRFHFRKFPANLRALLASSVRRELIDRRRAQSHALVETSPVWGISCLSMSSV